MRAEEIREMTLDDITARIRELEESPGWLAARGSRQQRSRTSDASREIIELAVRYSLISRETSFVAVERREQPVHDGAGRAEFARQGGDGHRLVARGQQLEQPKPSVQV